MRPIINTWDQCVAAGGDRIAIYWFTADKWRTPHWSVSRFNRGREVKTDPDAHWEDKGCKVFMAFPVRQEKPKQLAAAIAWVAENYGPREFVRNRMGDYVEREVNERFPIPKSP